MPLSVTPTFNGGPPYFVLPVGASGQVLTSNGAGAAPSFKNATAGGIGSYLSYALASGTTNDLDPGGGWPTGIGRLDLDTSAGAATITGLVAGSDAQIVIISNIGANTLTLAALNAGSSAANRFRYVADIALAQYDAVLAVYYGGTVNKWVLT